MKTVVVVASGAADRPLEELGGRTPLEAAATPTLDRIARDGRVGRLTTAPDGLKPEEGAFALALFGLDPHSYADAGATLDAAAFDVEVDHADLALRLSFVTADDTTLFDPTCGDLLREESALLLEALAEALGEEEFRFHPGHGARNLMVWRGARAAGVKTVPPYDVAGRKFRPHLPKGSGVDALLALIERSATILPGEEVNELRRELGENPATLAWPWGPGFSVPLPDFTTRTGADAHVVGVQPTFVGAARLQGVGVTTPPGATGTPQSNLRGKCDAALEALPTHDLVYLHVDAPAAASTRRDFVAKVEALERIDGYILGPLVRALDDGLPARVVLIAGEAASTEAGCYLPDPAPFAVYGAGVRSTRKAAFTEVGARDAGFHVEQAHELLEFLLHLPA